jgi:hypothetical protein
MKSDLGGSRSMYRGKCSTGTVQCYNMELRSVSYMTGKKRHGPYKRCRNHARHPFLAPKNIYTKNVYCNNAQSLLRLALGSYGNSWSVTPELTLFPAACHVLFITKISNKDNNITLPTSLQVLNIQYYSRFRGLCRWFINLLITILSIIHRPVFYLKLNSICLSVPHRKHITSPLRAQQVNVIYWSVTMVY